MNNVGKTRTFVTLVTSIGLMSTLSACSSSGETYGTPEAVVDAYVSAGGECGSPSPLPAFNESYGIYGFNCESGDAVLWFVDEDGKKNWLSLLEGTSEKYVVGPNWLVMTEDVSMITASMGGQSHG